MSVGARQEVEHPLAEQVREVALSGEVTIPPLPEIGQRLMTLLQDCDQANPRQIANTVGSDPAITSALLRMANSAYFGGLEPISDLMQAIGRLGMKRVGSLAAMLFHQAHFAPRNESRRKLLETLWGHSVASAIASRQIATCTGANAEESYLSGLLHDIGKLLALESLDHILASGTGIELTQEVQDDVMENVHTELGHLVLTQWRVPDPICRVALLHHRPVTAIDDGLILRVQASDAIAMKIGIHPHPDPDLVLEDDPALERLQLTEMEIAALRVDLEDEMEKLLRLF